MSRAAFAARAAALLTNRWLRLAVGFICFAAITVVTVLIAHPKMFSEFLSYDDEGYMLTALKAYVHHGHLYDRVFTQYGPFYFELYGGVFSIFGITVSHDSGRTLSMIVWVLTSLVFGLGILKITSSIFLGIATQVMTFIALEVLINEPTHPIGLIGLMLATIVALAAFVRERESPYAMALLGAAVAAVVLTKINVGLFAAVSVALACAVSYQQLWGRTWPRIVVEVIFVAIPVALLSSKFHAEWARHFAVHVVVAALAVIIVLRANQPARRPVGELRWLVGGFVVLVVVSLATIIASGTSVHGLINGLIRQPLHQADAFTIPLALPPRTYAFDLIALGAACAYAFATRRRRGEPSPAWLAAWSVFAIAVGVTMGFSVTGAGLPFDNGTLPGHEMTMLPFAWVALLVTAPTVRPRASFARLLLPLLAVLQALHAYPVAGSQTLLAVVLLVPVGALCVANGMQGLARLIPVGPDRLALAGFVVVVAFVLAWFGVNTYLREPLNVSRSVYNAGHPLDLPGSHEMHLLGEEEIELYENISHAIRRNCEATVMEPGMDSFYLWAEQEPPSLTATAWETLFDVEQQQQVIDDTEGIERLCLLRNEPEAAGWGLREGALTRYLEKGFRPVSKWGAYELLRRDGKAETSR